MASILSLLPTSGLGSYLVYFSAGTILAGITFMILLQVTSFLPYLTLCELPEDQQVGIREELDACIAVVREAQEELDAIKFIWPHQLIRLWVTFYRTEKAIVSVQRRIDRDPVEIILAVQREAIKRPLHRTSGAM